MAERAVVSGPESLAAAGWRTHMAMRLGEWGRAQSGNHQRVSGLDRNRLGWTGLNWMCDDVPSASMTGLVGRRAPAQH